MTRRAALLLAGLAHRRRSFAAIAVPGLIIDTDAGTDDLLAIAFLLSRTDIQIEAITLSNGLAHVQAGGLNILRLLHLAHKTQVPVYLGRESPLQGKRAFPAEWRRNSDELPGVQLPAGDYTPSVVPAADFLTQRLRVGSTAVRILALGPLTNLAQAFQRIPQEATKNTRLTIMGGALHLPGNLGDGGVYATRNKTAEWNIYVDPLAASVVLGSNANITLVPLDATAKVPIDIRFLEEFRKRARTPLGRFAVQVLETDLPFIQGGYFQAWDPLAAVAVVQPDVLRTERLAIDVLQSPPEDGRTVESRRSHAKISVAIDANAQMFKRVFLSALV